MADVVSVEAPVTGVSQVAETSMLGSKKPRSALQQAQLEQARMKAMTMRKERAAQKVSEASQKAQEATPPTPAPSPAAEAPPPAQEVEEEEEVVEEVVRRPKKTKKKRVIRVVESSSSDESDVEIRLPKRSKEKAAQSSREAAEQQRFNAAYSKLFDI